MGNREREKLRDEGRVEGRRVVGRGCLETRIGG